MSDIGKMIKSKGKKYSIGIREINIKANGKIINRKEMTFSNIKMNLSMVIDMKADGEIVGKHVTLTKDCEVKSEYFSLKL